MHARSWPIKSGLATASRRSFEGHCELTSGGSPYAHYVGLLQYVAREFDTIADLENKEHLKSYANIIHAICSAILHEGADGNHASRLTADSPEGVD